METVTPPKVVGKVGVVATVVVTPAKLPYADAQEPGAIGWSGRELAPFTIETCA